MTQEAGTPRDFWDRIQKMIEDAVAKLARSGMLRNASIAEGGLTIKGGFLRLMSAVVGGVETFYAGPITPALPDGSYQPGMIVRRNDGTVVLQLWDPIPSVGDYSQFLAWLDRQGNAIFTDDTDSGFGIARPHLAHSFYPSRVQDFPTTTSATFETIFRARVEKQQSNLFVQAWGATDTAGTTGEVQVTVNGTILGTVQTATSGVINGYNFGPAAVAGNFGDILNVEIQARRTAGTGNVQAGARLVSGWQT